MVKYAVHADVVRFGAGAGTRTELVVVRIEEDGASSAAVKVLELTGLNEHTLAMPCMVAPAEEIDEFLQAMVECAYKRGILPADLNKPQPMQWVQRDPQVALVAALEAHIADLQRMIFGSGPDEGTIERAYAAADDFTRGVSSGG